MAQKRHDRASLSKNTSTTAYSATKLAVSWFQIAVQFSRKRGIDLILAFLLGLASTAAWEHWFSERTDALMGLRDRIVNVRAELMQFATVTYFLKDNPNFKNSASLLSPFGLEVPETSKHLCAQKIQLLNNDVVNILGSKSEVTAAIKRVKTAFNINSVGTIAYGSPQFISEMQNAKTPGQQIEVVTRYNKVKVGTSEASKKNKHKPIIVAPGSRLYFMEQTTNIFKDLDYAITQIDRMIAKE